MKLCPSCGHPESWAHRCGGDEGLRVTVAVGEVAALQIENARLKKIEAAARHLFERYDVGDFTPGDVGAAEEALKDALNGSEGGGNREHLSSAKAAPATSPEASPMELHKQTGGGDAYRVAMMEHGYVVPTAPWERKPEPGSGRMLQCGNLHPFNWSEWQIFEWDQRGKKKYEARWCRTCATTQAREVGA